MKDHKLTFRGNRSGWGVANVEKCQGSSVPVGVWSISANDEINLDRYEGYPRLYGKFYEHVVLDGETITALIYVMQNEHDLTLPSDSYYNTILEGYRDFGIDPAYLNKAIRNCIEEVRTQEADEK